MISKKGVTRLRNRAQNIATRTSDPNENFGSMAIEGHRASLSELPELVPISK
jgi:hypothetical protein